MNPNSTDKSGKNRKPFLWQSQKWAKKSFSTSMKEFDWTVKLQKKEHITNIRAAASHVKYESNQGIIQSAINQVFK
jgi:hypothetical protein